MKSGYVTLVEALVTAFMLAASWLVLVTAIGDSYSVSEINKACVRHHGVERVSDTTRFPSVNYSVVAVCRDGVAKGIK